MTPRQTLFVGAGISFAAVAFALATQVVYDLLPCPWCIVQRIAYLVTGTVCLAFALAQRPSVGLSIASVTALGGLASATWQHLSVQTSAECGLSLAQEFLVKTGLSEVWPLMFEPLASCTEAAAPLFGVNYEVWSGLLFFGLLVFFVKRLANR